MTTATQAKPVRPKAKPAAKKVVPKAKEPEPTLFERLRDGLDLLKRHLAGEDVGEKSDGERDQPGEGRHRHGHAS